MSILVILIFINEEADLSFPKGSCKNIVFIQCCPASLGMLILLKDNSAAFKIPVAQQKSLFFQGLISR